MYIHIHIYIYSIYKNVYMVMEFVNGGDLYSLPRNVVRAPPDL